MRQVWWMCSGDHIGVVEGKTCLTKAQQLSLMKRVFHFHTRRHPGCMATTFTIAAKRDSLTEEKGRLVFSVPKENTFQGSIT